MLVFATEAPEVKEFRLGGQLVHFGGTPKPWKLWMKRHLAHYDGVIAAIDWLEAKGCPLPPRPWHLTAGNRMRCVLLAYAYEVKHWTQRQVRDAAKKLVRRFKPAPPSA